MKILNPNHSMLDPWLIRTYPGGSLMTVTAEGRSQGFLATCGKHVFLYDDDTANLLHTFEIDLSGARSATLYYNLLYGTEAHWDGMIVVATTSKTFSVPPEVVTVVFAVVAATAKVVLRAALLISSSCVPA